MTNNQLIIISNYLKRIYKETHTLNSKLSVSTPTFIFHDRREEKELKPLIVDIEKEISEKGTVKQ